MKRINQKSGREQKCMTFGWHRGTFNWNDIGMSARRIKCYKCTQKRAAWCSQTLAFGLYALFLYFVRNNPMQIFGDKSSKTFSNRNRIDSTPERRIETLGMMMLAASSLFQHLLNRQTACHSYTHLFLFVCRCHVCYCKFLLLEIFS